MPSPDRRTRRIDERLTQTSDATGTPITTGGATVSPAIPAPQVPSGLTIVSTFVVYSAVSPQAAATIRWTPITTPPPDAYAIQWSTASNFANATTVRTGRGQSSATIDGLPTGTLVYVRIAAIWQQVQSSWSSGVSTTTASDTTAPAAPPSLNTNWSSVTGDLTITWTNPSSTNFRDVRIRIYDSNGGVLRRTAFVSGQTYVYTLAQNNQDTANAPDPSVYIELDARNWNGAGNYSGVTASTATLALPANVTMAAGSPTFDFLTGSATWRWSAATNANYYRLTIDGVARDVYSTTYTYSLQQNASEHSGTPDASLAWSIVGVDALGQVSASATSGTATLADPGTVQNVTATWNGATGECAWNWSALASTTGYRLTIDGIARTVTGTSYSYTLDQNKAEHGATADPTLAWSVVGVNGLGRVSATAVTGTATLAAPTAPSGLVTDFASPDLVLQWTLSSSVTGYRVRFNGATKPTYTVGYSNTYTYTLAQNAQDNTNPDPSIGIELWAVDALGQVSTATTATATSPTPVAPSAVTLAGYFSTLTGSITHSPTRTFSRYQFRLTQSGSTILTEFSSVPFFTASVDKSGTYRLHVLTQDVFGRDSVETQSADATLVSISVEELRANAIYSDSTGNALATLAALKDNNTTSDGVTYSLSTSAYRWTECARTLSDRYKTITAGLFSVTSNMTFYIRTFDGTTTKWFAGPVNVVNNVATLTVRTNETDAQNNAVAVAPTHTTRTRWTLPAIEEAINIRLYHRNTGSGYIIREFYPRRLVQSDDIEAESILAINIAAGTITGDRISAGTITAGNIAAGTITTSQLNFTPVQTGNVVASINASAEGIRISGNRITIDGNVTFASGYNPTTKIASGGAAADVNANVTTISGGKISANTITAAQIAAGTITATELAAGSVTATKISVTSLSAISANLGTITAGTITGGTIRTGATGARVVLDSTGLQTYNGSNVLQISATTANSGELRAGAVTLSNSGISLIQDLTTTNTDIKWVVNDVGNFYLGSIFHKIDTSYSVVSSKYLYQITNDTYALNTDSTASNTTTVYDDAVSPRARVVLSKSPTLSTVDLITYNSGGVIDAYVSLDTTSTASTVGFATSGSVRLSINTGGQVLAHNTGTAALPSLVKNDDTNTGIYFPAADTIGFSTAGVERARINSLGNIVLAQNAGIDFSNNANAAGMTSELLDDYEEGTWTPSYTTDNVTFGSITYNIQIGRYTKIGESVTVWFAIRTNAITVGSASGNVVISGLPFTTANITGFYCTGSLGAATGFGTNTPSKIVADLNQTRAFIYYRDAADGTTTPMAPGDLATGTNANLCYGTITYRV